MGLLTFATDVMSPALRTALQRLDRLVDWERNRRAVGAMRLMRVTSKPALDLLERIGNPNKSFQAVHVTGSKGKGSVAALVSAALRDAPFTTVPIGTYGSPHVESVGERVRLDGVPISDDALAFSLKTVLDVRDQHPTLDDAAWFDVITVAAMHAFRRAGIKWAVVEVGIGGRLDSTNVLSAPVSVITNIHLEHAELIGPTVADIAHEKAGIIAPGADVILGMPLDDPLAPIFLREAAEQHPPATVSSVAPLPDSIFARNLSIARAAVQAVAKREGVDIPAEQLLTEELARSALAALPARQEAFNIGSTAVLLDGAHVPASVAQVLSENREDDPPIIVLGVGTDKDVAGICRVVVDENPFHIFATVAGSGVTYLPYDDLVKALHEAGATKVTAGPDALAALHSALDLAHEKGKRVIVIGSLHLAGRVRPELRRLDEEDGSSERRNALPDK